jgi:glycosyltransferase involved in cell wall biosynthesis
MTASIRLAIKNILYIAPDISVKGGISTVIKGYLSTILSQKYNIILISSHVDGSKLRKLFQAILGLLKTLYYLTFKHIDIVHIHGSDIVSSIRKYIFFRLVKIFRCKVIYHFHGASFLDQYPQAPTAWKIRIRQLFEDSDLVICLSESWRSAIMQVAPKSKVQVIYNSVPLPMLEMLTRKERDIINITFLGLIGERKGIFDLIEVVSRLVKDGHRVHLSIGGNGDVERLHEEIDTKGLKSHAKYVGWIVGDAKDDLLRNTDIFVLPSHGEGMPMTILEAMSYGIPVISTSVGGIPELITDGSTGYIVKPGDLDDLYSKLLSLVTANSRRVSYGQAGRKVIEERHNLLVNIDKIDEIYNLL